jgi:hypothetical protein
MAKKKIESTLAPVITSLPMASADSPLVIDLPDGQKLVVGTMAAGTVIEVATWRGTGRPDSRTSRLMLGMSSNDANPQSSGSAQTPPQEQSQKSLSANKYLAIAQRAGITVFFALKKFMAGGPKKTKNPGRAPESFDSEPKNSSKSSFKFSFRKPASPLNKISSKKSEDLADKEFQTWLDSISKKNEKLASFSSLDKTDEKTIKEASKELDVVFGEGKISQKKVAPKKAAAKKSAKKAAPKSRRPR